MGDSKVMVRLEETFDVPKDYSIKNQLLIVIVYNWIDDNLWEQIDETTAMTSLAQLIEKHLQSPILSLDIKKTESGAINGEITLIGENPITFTFEETQHKNILNEN